MNDNILDLFEKLSLGRAVVHKAMAGNDFVCFPDAIPGEWRRCFVPITWYSVPSKSPERRMVKTPRGWDFWTTREQLALDVVETLRQMDSSKEGTLADVRWRTLQRLMTADEWRQAEEAWAHGRSTATR